MTTPWQAFAERWKDCRSCRLCEQRDKIVLARGTIPCDILMVGEAPGLSENSRGLPFDGPAGHRLDQIVAKVVADMEQQERQEQTTHREHQILAVAVAVAEGAIVVNPAAPAS